MKEKFVDRQIRLKEERGRELKTLEASPIIQKIKKYLEENPPPEWRCPEKPDEIPFPQPPTIPEYTEESTDYSEKPEEFKDGAVISNWVCPKCGTKTPATKQQLVEEWDNETGGGHVPQTIVCEKPATPRVITNKSTSQHQKTSTMTMNGGFVPKACCYNEDLEKYRKKCLLIKKGNDTKIENWEKIRNEANAKHNRELKRWQDSSPKPVQFIFPTSPMNPSPLYNWFMGDYFQPSDLLEQFEQLKKSLPTQTKD